MHSVTLFSYHRLLPLPSAVQSHPSQWKQQYLVARTSAKDQGCIPLLTERQSRSRLEAFALGWIRCTVEQIRAGVGLLRACFAILFFPARRLQLDDHGVDLLCDLLHGLKDLDVAPCHRVCCCLFGARWDGTGPAPARPTCPQSLLPQRTKKNQQLVTPNPNTLNP